MTTEAKSPPKFSSSADAPPMAEFGPRRLDCCSLMEPEPGRCRRTDGKKWRCKNDVVPNTKYCERHIHRGCNRSRKLVEGSGSNQTASRPSMTSQHPQRASSYATPLLLRSLPRSDSTKNLENLCDVSIAASKDARANSSDPSSQDKASTMVGLGFKPTHNLVAATLGGSKRSPLSENLVFTHTVELVDAAYKNGIGKEHTVVTGSSKVPFDSMAATPSNVTGRKIMAKDVGFASSSCATSTSTNSQAICRDSVTKRTTSIRDIDKLKVNTSQGFNFSPKSVLQHANDHHPNPSIQGCSPSCFYRSDSEVQPWRCRRTDGRKWRCRKDVLPDEKYCAMHMHRGAKKQLQNSQLAYLPSSKRSKATHSHLNLSLSSKEKCTSLNTDLSISALEISRPTEDDEPSTTGGSTDATISDDITSYENN